MVNYWNPAADIIFTALLLIQNSPTLRELKSRCGKIMFNYPAQLWVAKTSHVLLSSSNYLGNPVAALDISADAWFLLEKLSSHLEALSLSYSQIVNDLICNGLYSIDNSSHSIVTGQDTAVKNVANAANYFHLGTARYRKKQKRCPALR